VKALRALVVLAVAVAGASAASPHAAAAPGMRVGLMDDALIANRPDLAWPWIRELNPGVIRFNLDWPRIAPRRPADARDHRDPAYRFAAVDRVVENARRLGIDVELTIVHTPFWAGGGARHVRGPRRLGDLRDLSYAAASRYAGVVRLWGAWNEPNLPEYLQPQVRLVRGRRAFASPAIYAGLLGAIYDGVHQAGRERHVPETVAGGETSPYGCGLRCPVPSVAPLTFLRQLHALGARFDAWAHHPYRIRIGETPLRGNRDPQVSFGNLGELRRTLDKLYPRRRVPVWLDELGYQTNPPDAFLGVSPATQARYLAQTVTIARRVPGVQMLVWFMLRDEAIGDRPGAAGFQTGLVYATNRLKPSFGVFAGLTGGSRTAPTPLTSGELEQLPPPPPPHCLPGFDARPATPPAPIRCVRRPAPAGG
jgi:hypothetical protein